MLEAATIELGTMIDEACIHYTLDGSEPSAGSPRYTEPIRIQETTRVRMAVFVNDTQVGETVAADYIKIPSVAG